jgi:hypothetical protein
VAGTQVAPAAAGASASEASPSASTFARLNPHGRA